MRKLILLSVLLSVIDLSSAAFIRKLSFKRPNPNPEIQIANAANKMVTVTNITTTSSSNETPLETLSNLQLKLTSVQKELELVQEQETVLNLARSNNFRRDRKHRRMNFNRNYFYNDDFTTGSSSNNGNDDSSSPTTLSSSSNNNNFDYFSLKWRGEDQKEPFKSGSDVDFQSLPSLQQQQQTSITLSDPSNGGGEVTTTPYYNSNSEDKRARSRDRGGNRRRGGSNSIRRNNNLKGMFQNGGRGSGFNNDSEFDGYSNTYPEDAVVRKVKKTQNRSRNNNDYDAYDDLGDVTDDEVLEFNRAQLQRRRNSNALARSRRRNYPMDNVRDLILSPQMQMIRQVNSWTNPFIATVNSFRFY